MMNKVMNHLHTLEKEFTDLQVMFETRQEENYEVLWYKEMMDEESLQEDDDENQIFPQSRELEEALVKISDRIASGADGKRRDDGI